MDLFVEQLLTRRNPLKEQLFRLLMLIVFGFAAGFSILAALFSWFGMFSFLGILAAAALCYGAWYLNGMLNLEFEYILTNGDVDIDSITNRAKRKRITSFECKNVESVERYRPDRKQDGKTVILAGNADAEMLMAIDVMSKKNGRILLVLEPEQKFYEAFRRCLPRSIAVTLPENVTDLS